MPFSWNNDNAAAAANAGRALSGIGNLIYESQVNKPAIQAQTAQTQANTAFTTGPQTDALRQQIVSQTLQNKAALFGQLSQHPLIDPDAINAAANGQATDTSTQANSPQSSTTAPVTGPAGGGASGPAPTGANPMTVSNTPAGGAVNNAGSSTQGPDTRPQPRLPYTDAELSPNLTQPGLRPFSETPTRGATTSPAPGASPVSPVPPVTSPVAPSVPVGGFDFRKNLRTPIDELPNGAQTELLNQMRKPFTDAGLPVSDQELVGHYQNLQAQMIPPAMTRGDFVPTTLQDGKVNGVFTNGINALGGGAGGNQADKARIFDSSLGHYVDNPAFTKPGDVESTQSSLDSNTQAQKLLDSAKDALASDPSVVGPKFFGQHVANSARSGEAIIGHPANKTAEATIRRFQSGEFLTSLGGLKGVGRLDIPVVETAKKGMPEQGDTVETWQKYFDQAQDALTANRNALMQEYRQQTGGKASLSAVDVEPPVSAPGGQGASAPASTQQVPVLTPEQAKAAPKGTHFRTTDGRELWK